MLVACGFAGALAWLVMEAATGNAGKGLFLVAGIAFLIVSTVREVRRRGDLLSPLVIVVVSAGLRLGMPALALWFQGPPEMLNWTGIGDDDWWGGGELAVGGLCAVAIGWLSLPQWASAWSAARVGRWRSMVEIDHQTFSVAVVAMGLGIALLIVFLVLNYGDPVTPIVRGIIRLRELRQAGTSRYNLVGKALLVLSSVLMSAYLLHVRRAHWAVGLAPGVGAMLLLSPFGQRIGALGPACMCLMLLWYRQDAWRRAARRIAMVAPFVVLFLAIYFIFVGTYRGGVGVERAGGSLLRDGILEYSDVLVWSEFGTLMPFALAASFDPAAIGTDVLRTIGGEVLEPFTGAGVRPGVFLIEQRGLSADYVWGIHSGLIIDMYLGVGWVGVVVGGIVFGMAVHLLYEAFFPYRRTGGVAVVYGLLTWSLVWVFYESVAGFATTMIHLVVFLGGLFMMSRVLGAVLGGHRALESSAATGRARG